MRTKSWWAAPRAAVVVALLTFGAAACGGGGERAPTQAPPETSQAPSAVPSETGAAHDVDAHAAEVATVLAAIDIVDSAGFHDMGEELAGADEVPESWAGRVGKAIIAAQVAAWPEGHLPEGADELIAALTGFRDALEVG
ncbi:MAG: hypothetical protein HY658_06415, partial [Actinobacteria bacterium]|nr:hypothetical protein [Actinomycetota bacterium]